MSIHEDQSLSDSFKSTLSTDSLSDSSNPLGTRNPFRQSNRSALQENPERISALTQNQVAYSPSTTGVFTVGKTGKVSFDFLFDGGMYQGEVAVFKLSGLEQFAPGSPEFIREAARRSLSNSNEGHVIISDLTEGAKIQGKFDWDSAYNLGGYTGTKTFDMTSGDLFAILLVPDGSVQEIFNNPNSSGAKRPVFSVSTSNPEDATHVTGIKTVKDDGQVIGIEDLREDGKSDRDFTDIIFYMEGATGNVVSIDAVIKPVYRWRTNEVGKQLLDFKPTQKPGSVGDPPTLPTPPIPDHWNAKFINFSNNEIAEQPDFSKAIATLDLGVQRDNDGKIHLLQDFRTDSPAPKVNSDYFGMEASTEIPLDADKLYKITSKSDDGTKFFLQKKDGEKKSITEFGGWTEGDWRDRSIADPERNIYFKVTDPGQYEIYVQYYDKEGNAAVDVTLEEAKPFADKVDPKNWQADVFWWNGTKDKQPPVKVDEAKNKIGTIELKSSDKPGIQFDWKQGSLTNNDAQLPGDNFAIVAYTQASFDGTYEFSASGDDGFKIFAKKKGTNETVYITPKNEWQTAYSSPESEQPLQGEYDVYVEFYETGGDAKFDLSWVIKSDIISDPPVIPVLPAPGYPESGYSPPITTPPTNPGKGVSFIPPAGLPFFGGVIAYAAELGKPLDDAAKEVVKKIGGEKEMGSPRRRYFWDGLEWVAAGDSPQQTKGIWRPYTGYDNTAALYHTEKYGTIAVKGVIGKFYDQFEKKLYGGGGSQSSLGFPIRNEYKWWGGYRQDFEGGYIYFPEDSIVSAKEFKFDKQPSDHGNVSVGDGQFNSRFPQAHLDDFVNAFNHYGGTAKLGSPLKEKGKEQEASVHEWRGYLAQELDGGSDGRGALIQDQQSKETYWLSGKAFQEFSKPENEKLHPSLAMAYTEYGGSSTLGNPISSLSELKGRQIQFFEGGVEKKDALFRESDGKIYWLPGDEKAISSYFDLGKFEGRSKPDTPKVPKDLQKRVDIVDQYKYEKGIVFTSALGGSGIYSNIREYFLKGLYGKYLEALYRGEKATITSQDSTPREIGPTYVDVTHLGIDSATTGKNGAKVHALVGGFVVEAYQGKISSIQDYRDNSVVSIWNPDLKRLFIYLHFAKVNVQENTWVNSGDVIGIEGTTGKSNAPHTHVEVHPYSNVGNPKTLKADTGFEPNAANLSKVEDPLIALNEAQKQGILNKKYPS